MPADVVGIVQGSRATVRVNMKRGNANPDVNVVIQSHILAPQRPNSLYGRTWLLLV